MVKRFCSRLGLTALFVLFTLQSGTAEVTRVAFLSDLHVNLQTNGPGSAFNPNLGKMIEAVNAAKVDLVLLGGDLTDNGTPEQMEKFSARIAKFSAPVLFVAGNHDVGRMRTKAGLNTITPKRLSEFEDRLGPLFFEKQHGNVRIIGITAPLFCSDLEAEKAQWQFLEKTLAASNSTPTLMLTHFPVFYDNPSEPPADYWKTCPDQRTRFLNLLRKGNVKAVLAGHTHRKLILDHENIRFVTAGAIANRDNGKANLSRFAWVLLTITPEGAITSEFQSLAPAS